MLFKVKITFLRKIFKSLCIFSAVLIMNSFICYGMDKENIAPVLPVEVGRSNSQPNLVFDSVALTQPDDQANDSESRCKWKRPKQPKQPRTENVRSARVAIRQLSAAAPVRTNNSSTSSATNTTINVTDATSRVPQTPMNTSDSLSSQEPSDSHVNAGIEDAPIVAVTTNALRVPSSTSTPINNMSIDTHVNVNNVASHVPQTVTNTLSASPSQESSFSSVNDDNDDVPMTSARTNVSSSSFLTSAPAHNNSIDAVAINAVILRALQIATNMLTTSSSQAFSSSSVNDDNDDAPIASVGTNNSSVSSSTSTMVKVNDTRVEMPTPVPFVLPVPKANYDTPVNNILSPICTPTNNTSIDADVNVNAVAVPVLQSTMNTSKYSKMNDNTDEAHIVPVSPSCSSSSASTTDIDVDMKNNVSIDFLEQLRLLHDRGLAASLAKLRDAVPASITKPRMNPCEYMGRLAQLFNTYADKVKSLFVNYGFKPNIMIGYISGINVLINELRQMEYSEVIADCVFALHMGLGRTLEILFKEVSQESYAQVLQNILARFGKELKQVKDNLKMFLELVAMNHKWFANKLKNLCSQAEALNDLGPDEYQLKEMFELFHEYARNVGIILENNGMQQCHFLYPIAKSMLNALNALKSYKPFIQDDKLPYLDNRLYDLYKKFYNDFLALAKIQQQQPYFQKLGAIVSEFTQTLTKFLEKNL